MNHAANKVTTTVISGNCLGTSGRQCTLKGYMTSRLAQSNDPIKAFNYSMNLTFSA
jgi:hypothetical protein